MVCATLTLMCCGLFLALEYYFVFVVSCSWGTWYGVPVTFLAPIAGVLSLILLLRDGSRQIGCALLCIAFIVLMMQGFVIEIHAKCLSEKTTAQTKLAILHAAVVINASYHSTNQLPTNQQEFEMLVRRDAGALVRTEYILYTKNHEEEGYQLTGVIGLSSYMYDSRYPHQGAIPRID